MLAVNICSDFLWDVVGDELGGGREGLRKRNTLTFRGQRLIEMQSEDAVLKGFLGKFYLCMSPEEK